MLASWHPSETMCGHCKGPKDDPQFKKCKNCRAANIKYYYKNKEKYRNKVLKRTYGITLEDYDKIYDKQNGKCAICKETFPRRGKEGLAVDHCHNKGIIRELLCCKCNTGIGNFKDNIILLEEAIKYLRKHNVS